MKTIYKSIIALLILSSAVFAQEVGDILWQDTFDDYDADSACLKDVGWMYYGEGDGLSGSIVKQTPEGAAFLQTGNFSSFVGAVVMQSNGCPEIDTADSDRGKMLLVDSSKGAPNVEITMNINFKKIESSFFSLATRMVQRDTSESYPDSDPTEEGAYQVFISPLQNQIAIARVFGKGDDELGGDEGGAEYDFLNPGNWLYLAAGEFEFEQNLPYWVKFYLYETEFKVKIWEGDLSDEEDVWLLEATEDTARVSGTFTQFAVLSSNPAATDQVEINEITVRTTGTGVGVEEEIAELPSKYELMANYPNPFNPATNIQFALPANANVKLTVVNTLGQVVAELVNGEMNVGVHESTWNAANMSSGIYFYRLEADNFVQTRKMMLLK
ncbi:MAG: T9SS type A sorting domain-containing protein [Bacteroidota bacterium]